MVRLIDRQTEPIATAKREEIYNHLLAWLVDDIHHYELYAHLYSRLGQSSQSQLCRAKALHLKSLVKQHQVANSPDHMNCPQRFLVRKLVCGGTLLLLVNILLLMKVFSIG